MTHLALFLLGTMLTLAGSAANAQHAATYPSKPVRVIVPFPPGAGTSLVARLFAGKLGEHMGYNFVIDNRPGASGRIGSGVVAMSDGDGYTLLYSPAGPLAIAQYLNVKLTFNPEKDLTPVALMVATPAYLVVNGAFPANTLEEFIAYARKNPGKINFGIPGIGIELHASLVKLRQQADVEITAVAYQGGAPVVVDLLAGRLDATFVIAAPVAQHLESGALRAIATLEPERVPDYPNVPSVVEAGYPGLVGSPVFGFFAPSSTPDDLIAKLSDAMVGLRQDEKLAAQVEEMGYRFEPIGSDAFRARMDELRAEFRDLASGGHLDRPN